MVRYKDIEGYEGIYQISDTGEVWTFKHKSPKPLKKRLNADGYVKASLTKDGRMKDYRVHRLVAEAFIPNPENKETVNHIDGDKENNHVANLEWATRSEQNLHSYSLGLKKAILGHENSNAKLKPDNVKYIRKHYIKGDKEFGAMNLGRKFNIGATSIENIVKGRTYKNVE